MEACDDISQLFGKADTGWHRFLRAACNDKQVYVSAGRCLDVPGGGYGDPID